jgi:glutaconate CoA-transferase subunit A
MRVSFLPCRAGVASDILAVNPDLRMVPCPYGTGESYVAVPALRLDAAIVHANRADSRGNAQYLGTDWYFDDLLCMAAAKRYVSCERIVDTAEMLRDGCVHSLRLNRAMVDGVVEAPYGAGFTSCPPDYGTDDAVVRAYAHSASTPGAWRAVLEFPRTGDGPLPTEAAT